LQIFSQGSANHISSESNDSSDQVGALLGALLEISPLQGADLPEHLREADLPEHLREVGLLAGRR
jgi:hypothetical protein